MDLLLHLHESLIMIMPPMIHQPGAITSVGIDLHLGQKPKLGGRYTDDSLIYTSYFAGTLYIHVSLSFFVVLVLISAFQNTKRPKIFPLFLFICLFSFLVSVCFTFYLWFGIQKFQKDFALVAISFCACFKIQKPKNICCSSLVL
jgi:cation transporter-like permease